MKTIFYLLTISFFLFLAKSNAATTQLWGMTAVGGVNGIGAIIKMNEDGSNFQLVFSFDSTTGFAPRGSLLLANNQKLYGMTQLGGLYGKGTIFSIDPFSNDFSVVHNFDSIDGSRSISSLIQASNGLLYGMTIAGGTINDGVIFSFNISTNAISVLYSFDGTHGANPQGRLLDANNGILYGMAAGGLHSDGVVFSFDTLTNVYTDLHDFNITDGQGPTGDLIQGNNGLLYGMTLNGGISGNGVLFSFDISTNIVDTLHIFITSTGTRPRGSLKQLNNGMLYGLTSMGGGSGALFSFNVSSNTYSDLFNFYNAIGKEPNGSLIHGNSGLLYGFGWLGGAYNRGTIFSFDTTTDTLIDMHDFAGAPTDGHQPYGDLTEVIVDSTTTGAHEVCCPNEVSIYPNPFSNTTMLYISGASSQNDYSLYIYNLLGQEVRSIHAGNKKEIVISREDLASGMYFYKLTDDKGSIAIGKLMIED